MGGLSQFCQCELKRPINDLPHAIFTAATSNGSACYTNIASTKNTAALQISEQEYISQQLPSGVTASTKNLSSVNRIPTSLTSPGVAVEWRMVSLLFAF